MPEAVPIQEEKLQLSKYMDDKLKKSSYTQEIRAALVETMTRDKSVFVIGEGVPDPKGIFGITLGLQKKFGANRVMDMPVAENGMTGICIGAALAGMRPILIHQRIDFSLLSMDQVANVAAKWYYMFGGKRSVPIVIHAIVGRGWGQGAQHSQSLQATFAHFPGLKVVMPALVEDVKGLYISAIYDNNPVLIIDHRWLHFTSGVVSNSGNRVPIGKARLLKRGKNITLVTSSFMTIEGIKATEILKKAGLSVEHIDLRSIKPLDIGTIIDSVKKTGRLLVADLGWKSFGITAEVITVATQQAFQYLRVPPERLTIPDVPTPTSWKLAESYYPTYKTIVEKIISMIGNSQSLLHLARLHFPKSDVPSDIPDPAFTGPF